MKIIHLLFVGCIVTATACSNPSSTSSTSDELPKAIRFDSLGFEIHIPKNWEVQPNSGKPDLVGVFETFNDSTDKFKENLQIWREEIPMPIPDSMYYQAAMTQIRIANPGLSVQMTEPIMIDSLKFRGFEFQFSTIDSTKYKVLGYTLLKGKYGYNLTFTAEQSKEKTYQPIFKKILHSFKLNK